MNSQFNMYRRTVLICCLLGFFTDFVVSGVLEGCNVGQTFENTNANHYSLSKFKNNSPKPDEVLRTKVYYKWTKPYFSFSSNSAQIVFGNYIDIYKEFK